MSELAEESRPKFYSVALPHSEARFQAMFEHAAVGIGLMGLDRRLIDANPALCQMLGYTIHELIGNTPEKITYPDDYPQSTQDFVAFLSTMEDHYRSERRYVRKNGDIFWAHVTMSVVRDDRGAPIYLVGMVIDIDDRKRALESEQRFRATFESSAIGIGLLGLDGKILKVNQAVCNMSGYSEAELLQRYDHQNVYPEDLDKGSDLLAELLAGKRDVIEVEKRYVRKNGDVFWTRLTLSAVKDEQANIHYLVGMIADIDEQKRVLAELHQSEARFRAVFESASVGVALMSLDREILTANKAAQDLTGYSEGELQTIPSWLLAIEQDRYLDRELFEELILGQRDQYTIEKRYQHKDGFIFWGRVNFSTVQDELGQPQYIVGLIEDITDEKQAAEILALKEREYRQMLEEKIAIRTEELNQANQLLQVKAAQEAVTIERTRLAHELHDAVTQTLFSASLIAEVLPDLWRIDVDEAMKSTEELRQLTRGALAEMRTLLLELRPAALTQASLGDLLYQLTEALIGRSRLPIKLNLTGDRYLPPEVQVVFYRIAQESLNNIIKYARAQNITIDLQLSPLGAHLEISDDGVGVDLHQIKPTSLGLRIMSERANSIEAEFQFNSKPGEGTTVSVTWQDQSNPGNGL